MSTCKNNTIMYNSPFATYLPQLPPTRSHKNNNFWQGSIASTIFPQRGVSQLIGPFSNNCVSSIDVIKQQNCAFSSYTSSPTAGNCDRNQTFPSTNVCLHRAKILHATSKEKSRFSLYDSAFHIEPINNFLRENIEDKKLNVMGRHTVNLYVAPSQHFLKKHSNFMQSVVLNAGSTWGMSCSEAKKAFLKHPQSILKDHNRQNGVAFRFIEMPSYMPKNCQSGTFENSCNNNVNTSHNYPAALELIRITPDKTKNCQIGTSENVNNDIVNTLDNFCTIQEISRKTRLLSEAVGEAVYRDHILRKKQASQCNSNITQSKTSQKSNYLHNISKEENSINGPVQQNEVNGLMGSNCIARNIMQTNKNDLASASSSDKEKTYKPCYNDDRISTKPAEKQIKKSRINCERCCYPNRRWLRHTCWVSFASTDSDNIIASGTSEQNKSLLNGIQISRKLVTSPMPCSNNTKTSSKLFKQNECSDTSDNECLNAEQQHQNSKLNNENMLLSHATILGFQCRSWPESPLSRECQIRKTMSVGSSLKEISSQANELDKIFKSQLKSLNKRETKFSAVKHDEKEGRLKKQRLHINLESLVRCSKEVKHSPKMSQSSVYWKSLSKPLFTKLKPASKRQTNNTNCYKNYLSRTELMLEEQQRSFRFTNDSFFQVSQTLENSTQESGINEDSNGDLHCLIKAHAKNKNEIDHSCKQRNVMNKKCNSTFVSQHTHKLTKSKTRKEVIQNDTEEIKSSRRSLISENRSVKILGKNVLASPEKKYVKDYHFFSDTSDNSLSPVSARKNRSSSALYRHVKSRVAAYCSGNSEAALYKESTCSQSVHLTTPSVVCSRLMPSKIFRKVLAKKDVLPLTNSKTEIRHSNQSFKYFCAANTTSHVIPLKRESNIQSDKLSINNRCGSISSEKSAIPMVTSNETYDSLYSSPLNTTPLQSFYFQWDKKAEKDYFHQSIFGTRGMPCHTALRSQRKHRSCDINFSPCIHDMVTDAESKFTSNILDQSINARAFRSYSSSCITRNNAFQPIFNINKLVTTDQNKCESSNCDSTGRQCGTRTTHSSTENRSTLNRLQRSSRIRIESLNSTSHISNDYLDEKALRLKRLKYSLKVAEERKKAYKATEKNIPCKIETVKQNNEKYINKKVELERKKRLYKSSCNTGRIAKDVRPNSNPTLSKSATDIIHVNEDQRNSGHSIPSTVESCSCRKISILMHKNCEEATPHISDSRASQELGCAISSFNDVLNSEFKTEVALHVLDLIRDYLHKHSKLANIADKGKQSFSEKVRNTDSMLRNYCDKYVQKSTLNYKTKNSEISKASNQLSEGTQLFELPANYRNNILKDSAVDLIQEYESGQTVTHCGKNKILCNSAQMREALDNSQSCNQIEGSQCNSSFFYKTTLSYEELQALLWAQGTGGCITKEQTTFSENYDSHIANTKTNSDSSNGTSTPCYNNNADMCCSSIKHSKLKMAPKLVDNAENFDNIVPYSLFSTPTNSVSLENSTICYNDVDTPETLTPAMSDSKIIYSSDYSTTGEKKVSCKCCNQETNQFNNIREEFLENGSGLSNTTISMPSPGSLEKGLVLSHSWENGISNIINGSSSFTTLSSIASLLTDASTALYWVENRPSSIVKDSKNGLCLPNDKSTPESSSEATEVTIQNDQQSEKNLNLEVSNCIFDETVQKNNGILKTSETPNYQYYSKKKVDNCCKTSTSFLERLNGILSISDPSKRKDKLQTLMQQQKLENKQNNNQKNASNCNTDSTTINKFLQEDNEIIPAEHLDKSALRTNQIITAASLLNINQKFISNKYDANAMKSMKFVQQDTGGSADKTSLCIKSTTEMHNAIAASSSSKIELANCELKPASNLKNEHETEYIRHNDTDYMNSLLKHKSSTIDNGSTSVVATDEALNSEALKTNYQKIFDYEKSENTLLSNRLAGKLGNYPNIENNNQRQQFNEKCDDSEVCVLIPCISEGPVNSCREESISLNTRPQLATSQKIFQQSKSKGDNKNQDDSNQFNLVTAEKSIPIESPKSNDLVYFTNSSISSFLETIPEAANESGSEPFTSPRGSPRETLLHHSIKMDKLHNIYCNSSAKILSDVITNNL